MAPPRSTACGSLVHYITSDGLEKFQPVNISFGLLSKDTGELKSPIRDRKERHRIQVREALEEMDRWIESLAVQ